MKLLVMGLDGATFRTLEPWMAQGLMPNLRALLAAGGRAVLCSTVPPVTAPAWVTCFSGVNPGRHGIFNFVTTGPSWGEHHPHSSRDVRVPRLWQHLSARGLVCHVVDVPLTFPPEPVSGVMVSDLMVAGDQAARTWPPALQDELRQALGRRFTWAIGDGLEVSRAYLEHLARSVEDKLALDRYLLMSRPCDAFFTVYQHTDVLAHYFWHVWDSSHPAYTEELRRRLEPGVQAVVRRIDAAVGELMALAGPDAYRAIVSDHGFGPVRMRVHLNDLLLDWGDLVLERGSRLELSLERLGLNRLGLGRAGLSPSGLVHLARRLDFLGLRRRLRLSMAREALALASRLQPRPDLSRSRAWFAHGLSPGLNLAPSVRTDEGYIRELIGRLRGLREVPGGPLVFERVCRREEVYAGPALELAPEVVLQPAEGFVASPELRGGRGFERPLPGQVSGFHRPDGVWILAGPGIPAGTKLEPVSIESVTPTLSLLLGEGMDAGWEGVAVDALWTGAGVVSRAEGEPGEGACDVGSAPGVRESTISAATEPPDIFTEEEAEEILRRLRALGYS